VYHVYTIQDFWVSLEQQLRPMLLTPDTLIFINLSIKEEKMEGKTILIFSLGKYIDCHTQEER